MPNTPLDLAARFRARLDRQSQADLDRLINAYGQMSQRLRDKVDALLFEIARNPDASIQQMATYNRLVDALNDEYERFAVYLETELEGIVSTAQSQARLDIGALIAAALTAYGITARPPRSMASTGILAVGSEHWRRLHELAPLQAQRIIDNLLEGIRRGYGYEKLGAMIVDDLGLGLSDALRWARTVQMEAYRDVSHQTMLNNPDIIDGWVRFEQIDERTCEDCAENHGKFYDTSQTLNDVTAHIWNCRGTEIPHVIGDLNPVTGEPVEEE